METISARLDIESVSLFEKVLGETRSEVVRSLVESGKKEKAVELYKAKKVSLGLGANLAGLTLSEFIDLLGQHNVDLNLKKEDVSMALATARKVL